MRAFVSSLVIALAAATGASPACAAGADPQQRAAEVLAAERAFAERGAADFLAAAEAMFAVDVAMPLPGGRYANGRTAALAAFRENPANIGSKARWAPIRVGVSADGSHAFTYGYMTITRADGGAMDAKYLSYWVRGDDGWQVAAYRRVPRAAGEVDTSMRAAALPTAGAGPFDGSHADHLRSLVAAEQAFSDQAQEIGLGKAFQANGSVDAMNMGGPDAAGFVFTAEAIGQRIGGGSDAPSPVSWSADRALVAPAGDLGVTFGLIHLDAPAGAATTPAAATPPPMAFFTVWRRAAPDAPWRYVAE